MEGGIVAKRAVPTTAPIRITASPEHKTSAPCSFEALTTE